MPATLSIKECNGAGPTATTVTTARFCTSDTYNPGTNYPLVKPTSGYNYSYKKTFYLNADTSPSSFINNVKFFCDGAINWTGVVVKVKTATSYTQATGTEGVTGDEMTGGVDITTYTSSSPLSVNGSISNPNTGRITDYVELQAVVSTSAVAGICAAETLTFRYDEV